MTTRNEAIAQAIAALQSIEPSAAPTVPTLLSRIADALSDGAFRHGSKTTFTPGHGHERFGVSVEAASIRYGGEPRLAQYLRLTIYGEMTYDARVDSGAHVAVHLNGGTGWPTGSIEDVHGRTHANAWNGTKYVDLPEGARQSIADLVATEIVLMLRNMGITIADAVRVLADEHAARESEHRIANLIGEALSALGKALA